jgi:hypothetical protein
VGVNFLCEIWVMVQKSDMEISVKKREQNSHISRHEETTSKKGKNMERE